MAKLGSLFDGAGTFPYAAELAGMRPLWSSEIAPFPRLVTAKRLPDVVQLGDVTQVRGDRIAPVDVITFGSPCQDLSVAGRRAGLAGARSGLFREAIRIITEMREATHGKYPAFIVWENVPGALDSHGGEDFRAVLEAVCRAADRNAAVPRPPGGKWSDAGAIVGDGYSVAWRILDARFWGVPQRRRRIFLVGDLRGGRAPQVLFEREGLSRRFAEIGRARQGTAGDFGARPDPAVYDGRGNGDGQTAPTLVGGHNDRVTDYAALIVGVDMYNQALTGDKTMTVCANSDYNHIPCVIQGFDKYNQATTGEVAHALRHGGEGVPAVCMATQQGGATITESAGKSGNNQSVICIDRAAYNQGGNAQYAFGIDVERAFTLTGRPGAVCYQKGARPSGKNGPQGYVETKAAGTLGTFRDTELVCYGVPLNFRPENCIPQAEQASTLCNGTAPGTHNGVILSDGKEYLMRRLTPLECCRLQGMPDDWCAGLAIPDPTDADVARWREVWRVWAECGGIKPKTDKQVKKWLMRPHSDSVEYEMWGNGIALPCALYVLEGIGRELEEK